MKKLFLLLTATALALPALAQTERGTTMIGLSTGNLNYSHESKGNNYFSAALYPSVGRFVVDNLALGATLNLGYDRTSSQYRLSSATQREVEYGIAPFARYYFIGQGKHRLFAEAGVDFSRRQMRYNTSSPGQPDYGQKGSQNSIGWHGALGYNYFLTPNAALEASVGYYRGRSEYNAGGPYPYYWEQRSDNALKVRVGFTVFLPSGTTAQ
ncbi:outer membrane beta-barrel protein [Hymenobacter sp. CRA2]|uniref:outer membrane beta-barrel protein n=1 Tax=Hymenobacter sp. CRA2 TaxID=1955620 RepID=UPI00098F69E4|nr:outer membrane beta-barrel protein [Hymenobacter sp. CRA2]OON70743.1 hypothetical protein B0919_01635 [Hymenobacter sp. CRA2]